MDGERQIAKVDGLFLGIEDHGLFSFMIGMDYGTGGHQGFGGYRLDTYSKAESKSIGHASGTDLLIRIMQAFGVNEWDKIMGRTVYATTRNGIIKVIEPLPTEKGKTLDMDEWVEECKARGWFDE